MKMRLLLPAVTGILFFFLVTPSGAVSQEYGKIRPLNQRALQVVEQRDAFVTQVLNAYGIAHERTPQGGILRIRVEGKWLAVTEIEIVPVVEETGGQRQVAAHELFFTTESGIMGLRSELKIR